MTDNNAVIQSEILFELKEILAEEFPQLVSTYLEDASQRLSRLEQAIASSDASGVKLEAHSLKGSSVNIGARGLADLCAVLETHGANQQLDEAPELFSRIRSEFTVTERFLHEQL